MSTTQDNNKYSDLVGDFFTALILGIAKGLMKIVMHALYRIFIFAMVVIVIAAAVAVVAGGTTLSAVLFGKVFACVFCLLAVGALFLIPVRSFFENISVKVKEVFFPGSSAQADPAAAV